MCYMKTHPTSLLIFLTLFISKFSVAAVFLELEPFLRRRKPLLAPLVFWNINTWIWNISVLKFFGYITFLFVTFMLSYFIRSPYRNRKITTNILLTYGVLTALIWSRISSIFSCDFLIASLSLCCGDVALYNLLSNKGYL